MKLGYSIVIILIVAVAAFFILKNKKPMDTNENQQSTETSNKEVENNMTSSNELIMTTTKAGEGEEAKDGDVVAVNYTGYLSDGTKFDSNMDHGGAPFEFTIGAGQVIKGWDIGVKGMKKGEIRRLVIPASMAYGERGYPGVIPANATLAFEVELLEINPAE